jgi:Tfp pilus assembly protein PilF
MRVGLEVEGWNVGARLLAVCLMALALAGCSEPEPPHADSLARYDEALAKLEAKDVAAARSAFAEAVALGGLRADLHAKATLQLAYCEACLGNFEEAKVLLDSLEQESPDLGEVFAMRSFVLRASGDKAEADAAWAKAKQWSPDVTLPQKP